MTEKAGIATHTSTVLKIKQQTPSLALTLDHHYSTIFDIVQENAEDIEAYLSCTKLRLDRSLGDRRGQGLSANQLTSATKY